MIYKHWVGTDALKLVKYPPGKLTWKFRIFIERMMLRIFGGIIDQHFVVHPRLTKLLVEFGIPSRKISVKVDKGICQSCTNICTRLDHSGVNIAYYYPGDRGNRKFKRWVYGMDIIEYFIIPMFPEVNWIHLDGSKDMCRIYPTLDAYIRPSRHDGFPRIIIECMTLGIPYFWSEDFNPNVERVSKFVKSISDNHSI